MKLEEFIDLYKNSGPVLKTIYGYYFQPNGWKSYSYPLNYPVNVTAGLVRSLKWRFLISTVFTESKRKNAIEFILETGSYEIDQFSRKTRNRLNKSLCNCNFKRPALDDLLDFGLKINRQTLKRQHRRDKILTNSKLWNRYITTLYNHNEIITLGAYYQERMVGYIIVYELDGVYNVLHAYIDRNDSEITSPMMGLIYTLVNQLIEKDGEVKLSYGLDSFNPEPELSRFKRNLLFKQTSVTRVYIINSLILFIFRMIILFNIRLLGRENIRNSFTRKIIQLYQGQRILIRSNEISLNKSLESKILTEA